MNHRGHDSAEPSTPTPTIPALNATTSSSSLWAASAPQPEPTPEWISFPNANSHDRSTDASTKPVVQTTLTWPNQRIAPADPMILGHSNHKIEQYPPTPIHFGTLLSPIPPHHPNISKPYMNEIYSFTQIHNNIDNTILLPLNIVNPVNATPNPMNEP